MCGIVGAFRFNQQPVRADMVEQMVNTLKHRGPDDAGVFVDGVVGLGHRRLKIIRSDSIISLVNLDPKPSVELTKHIGVAFRDFTSQTAVS